MGSGRKVAVHLEAVELARGYDGPLRGAPEPCLLFGAYLVRDGGVLPLGRALERLEVGWKFPAQVAPDRTLLNVRTFSTRQGADQGVFLLLAVAIEEDSGRGIRALFAALEEPAAVWLWRSDAHLPEPVPLEHVVDLPLEPPPAGDRVGLLVGGVPAEHIARSDDWVDALLARVPLDRYGPREYRFRFVSPDGRNDWTATIVVRVH